MEGRMEASQAASKGAMQEVTTEEQSAVLMVEEQSADWLVV